MSNRTTQENLSLLQQTRQNISDALSGKGASVTGAFSTFPDKVKNLNHVNEFVCGLMDRSVSMNNPVIDADSSRTAIKQYAFQGCSGLTGSLVIGDNITRIETAAFSGCTGLRGTITIGTGVTSIGSYAFDGIPKIQSITILATTPPTIGGANNSFGSPHLFNFPIYVPSASLGAYRRTYTSYDNAGRIKAIQDSRD